MVSCMLWKAMSIGAWHGYQSVIVNVMDILSRWNKETMPHVLTWYYTGPTVLFIF